MEKHEAREGRLGTDGPAHLICSCGLGYIADYQLLSRSYDYGKMQALMDAHLAAQSA